MRTDSELLSRYAAAHDEGAFGALLPPPPSKAAQRLSCGQSFREDRLELWFSLFVRPAWAAALLGQPRWAKFALSVMSRTMAELNAKRLANLVNGTESGRNARVDFFHESRTRNTHAIAHPLRAGLVQEIWLSDCVGWTDV
jgi:hypothetical protein